MGEFLRRIRPQRSRRRLDLPVSAQHHLLRGDGEAVTRRQAEDIAVGGGLRVVGKPGQESRNATLADACTDPVEAKHRPDLGGKGKTPVRGVVVEWFDAEMVARAEQQLPLGVPDGKGEIALQMHGAGFAPAQIGPHQQCCVRNRPVAYAEPRHQFVAIVQPAIGGDGELAAGHGQRAGAGFIRGVEPGVAKGYAGIQPPRISVGAAMAHAGQHLLDVGRRIRRRGASDRYCVSLSQQDSGHAAHRLPWSTRCANPSTEPPSTTWLSLTSQACAFNCSPVPRSMPMRMLEALPWRARMYWPESAWVGKRRAAQTVQPRQPPRRRAAARPCWRTGGR